MSDRCPCCGGYRDQYDACHFHETRDERERYREALETIARARGHNGQSGYWLKQVAREALDD